MNLHGEIMNIGDGCGLSEMGTTHGEQLAYKRGHRYARHAAAELAIASDARIAELERQLAEARKDADMMAQINRACQVLPDGFVIEIYLEKDAGTLNLYDDKFDAVDLSVDFDSFSARLEDAIDAAIKAKEPTTKT